MQKNYELSVASSVGRSLCCVAFILAGVLTIPSMKAQPSAPPVGLAEAGQAALTKFLPALDSPTMKQTHGFAPDDDFSAVTLGTPFEPRYLTPDVIGKYAKGAPVESVLTASRRWYFPVQSKGRLACLLSVIHRADDRLLEDKLGMAQLARIWAAVNEAWPAEKGNTPLLVIVPSHQRFYFTVPQAAPPNLTRFSIEQAETASPATFEKLTTADEAFAELREQSSPNR